MELNFLSHSLAYNFWLLLGGLALDLIFGDPVYRLHPIRLMGNLLSLLERGLFAMGMKHRTGGFILFCGLAFIILALYLILSSLLSAVGEGVVIVFEVVIVYHMLAFKDLLKHSRRIDKAAAEGDLEAARFHSSMLVGRDISKMDGAACRRAGVESVAESLVDGVLSPAFYLMLLGVPGILIFKIVSTMDSMVGYKNERYLYFGWFGARFDDVLNYLPARMTWLLMTVVSYMLPGYSGPKCFSVGLKQHAEIPGPNAGWSECAAAGALQIKIAGPIYKEGVLVTDIWLGDPDDREGGDSTDIPRMNRLAGATLLLFLGLCVLIIL